MSGKYVLILKGSPREKGNSSLLADQVAAGARAAGAEVESFHLHSMDIRPCDACDACQGTDADCIIEDDMQLLYPKLRSADAIVVASPIYWFTMSAQTKLCIDRWYALQDPQGNALAGKQIGIVLTYGDTALLQRPVHVRRGQCHPRVPGHVPLRQSQHRRNCLWLCFESRRNPEPAGVDGTGVQVGSETCGCMRPEPVWC
jgi:NAD(P)H-dependent FMN reductase